MVEMMITIFNITVGEVNHALPLGLVSSKYIGWRIDYFVFEVAIKK